MQRDVQKYTLGSLEEDLRSSPEALRTGIRRLDKLIRIPQAGLTIVAARLSHGKTTLMLNLLTNLCRNYPDKTFVYMTLHEAKRQVALKMINIMAEQVLDSKGNLRAIAGYLKKGDNSNEGIEKAKKEFAEFTENGRLYIFDELDNIEDIEETVDALRRNNDLGCVFIDYLQKIHLREWSLSREHELRRISNRVLGIAKGRPVPVVLGAQLQWDEKKVLRLDSFYDLSETVQDANMVLGIYNHAMESAQILGEVVEGGHVTMKISVLKNRDGLANEAIDLEIEPATLKILDTA